MNAGLCTFMHTHIQEENATVFNYRNECISFFQNCFENLLSKSVTKGGNYLHDYNIPHHRAKTRFRILLKDTALERKVKCFVPLAVVLN